MKTVPLLGLFILSVLVGCSRQEASRGTVQGEVKLDGQSIAQGSIQFLPMQGVEGPAAGGAIADGRYQLSAKVGPAVGWNRVEVHAMRKTGRVIAKPFPQRGTTEETVEAVPPQYNSASTLKFEIKPGDNRFDVNIEAGRQAIR